MIRLIIAFCCSIIALTFAQNIVAGIVAQSTGTASHQESGK